MYNDLVTEIQQAHEQVLSKAFDNAEREERKRKRIYNDFEWLLVQEGNKITW